MRNWILDRLFVLWTLIEVWFLSCPAIERRLDFLDAIDEKRKRQFPYKAVTFIYKSMLR